MDKIIKILFFNVQSLFVASRQTLGIVICEVNQVFSNFNRCVLFCVKGFAVAIMCWFVVSTASGNTASNVACSKNDSRTGVCQVQFTLYRQECTQGVSVVCSWGNIFDPERRGQICRTIFIGMIRYGLEIIHQ